MSIKKPYSAPRVLSYKTEAEYPPSLKELVHSLRVGLDNHSMSQGKVRPEHLVIVDPSRRYIEVSDSFCALVGYGREELVGRPFDDLTAPNSTDVPTVFRLFLQLGYMHGLWMLASRQGKRILVRYEAWLRPDKLIESHMELLREEV